MPPCPRCSSEDTKWCYFNNNNVKQPRFFCKSCQRYWTSGGALRNVPPGSGRRKSKAISGKLDDGGSSRAVAAMMDAGAGVAGPSAMHSNFPMPAPLGMANPFGMAPPYGGDVSAAAAAAQLLAYQQQASLLGCGGTTPLGMGLQGMAGLGPGTWPAAGGMPDFSGGLAGGGSFGSPLLTGGMLAAASAPQPMLADGGVAQLQAAQQGHGHGQEGATERDGEAGDSAEGSASGSGAEGGHHHVRARTSGGCGDGRGGATRTLSREGAGSSPTLLAAKHQQQRSAVAAALAGSPGLGPGPPPMHEVLRQQQQQQQAQWLQQATAFSGTWQGLGLLGGGMDMASQQALVALQQLQQQQQQMQANGMATFGLGLGAGMWPNGMSAFGGGLLGMGATQSSLMTSQLLASSRQQQQQVGAWGSPQGPLVGIGQDWTCGMPMQPGILGSGLQQQQQQLAAGGIGGADCSSLLTGTTDDARVNAGSVLGKRGRTNGAC